MNIAVLGSNCKFSSDLAVKLNQLKNSSLVYRYDALADFKKEVPLYKSLLLSEKESARDVEPDLLNHMIPAHVEPTERDKNKTALGEYIGDVETLFLSSSPSEEEQKSYDTLKSIFNVLNTKVKKNIFSYGEQCINKKIAEYRKTTELFSSNVLNVISVFSGIVDSSMLDVLIGRESMMVIVKVKKGDSFLPCTITEKDLDTIKNKNPRIIVLEVSSVNELLSNNFFISTFNLKNKKQEKEKVENKKSPEPTEEGEIVDQLFEEMMANAA